MKRLFFTVVLVVWFIPYRLIAVESTCTTTVNPDDASVQSAVNAAKDGDVICLKAGNVTYNAGVGLGQKAVEIRGAGSLVSPWGSAAQTIIHLGNEGIAFSGWESTGHSTVIDNIQFTYGVGSAVPNFGVITWNRQSGGKPWIIHHNDFQVTGRDDRPVFIETGALGGLIYRNRFTAQAVAPPYINTNIEAVMQNITDDGSW